MEIQSLILVGGFSTRMGCPKYMLSIPNLRTRQVSPLLVVLLQRHFEFQTARCDRSFSIKIAVRNLQQQQEVHSFLAAQRLPKEVEVAYVTDVYENAGPASALLAAHTSDVRATWLVSGCDYPLITVEAFKQLAHAAADSRNAVTCFLNESNFREPLLALWKPMALAVLKTRMEAARLGDRSIGPNSVIKHLSDLGPDMVVDVTAADAAWLTNMNTMDDWMQICRVLIEPTA